MRATLYVPLLQVAAPTTSAWLAIEAAVIWNYWWNNRFTFNAYRHHGGAWLLGLVKFHGVAAHGLLVASATEALVQARVSEPEWTLRAVAMLAGLLLATVGNYHLNRSITWRTLPA